MPLDGNTDARYFMSSAYIWGVPLQLNWGGSRRDQASLTWGCRDNSSFADANEDAYLSEAEIYNGYSPPPLIQTLKEIKQEFSQQVFLKATKEDRNIIGSVRAYLEKETAYIGRLIVKPDSQNKGIGTRLMQAIEQHFKFADRYELFTGYKSARNLYLYQKLGYLEFKRIPVNYSLMMVFLEKYRNNNNRDREKVRWKYLGSDK